MTQNKPCLQIQMKFEQSFEQIKAESMHWRRVTEILSKMLSWKPCANGGKELLTFHLRAEEAKG